MLIRLILVLLSCSLANAQLDSTGAPVSPCPIQFVSINPTGNESFGHRLGNADPSVNDGHIFVLKIKNSSAKDIKGMKFQAAYLDATEDAHDIPVSWDWTDSVKSGAEKSFRWENAWRAESKVGWMVRLVKVLYADGSKWEETDTQPCAGSYWRDKKHATQ